MTRTTRRALAGPAALAAALALLAGCGQSDEVTTSPQNSSGVTGTDLTIVLDDGSGKTTTWQLTCDPAGGDHPAAEAACAALEARGGTALPPVPKDRMCTQIFGGAETATVKGTWRGNPVSSSFFRKNGCEIARWNAMKDVFPAAG